MKVELPAPTVIIKDKKILVKYISGLLLGDGCLRRRQDTWNAFYHLSQITIHRDYVFWQADILNNISSVKVWETSERVQTTRAIGKPCYHLDTGAVPFYTTLYERIYIDGHKTISPHDLKLMDWEVLALWYMDDGYYHQAHATSYFCTDCYSYGDCVLLQKAIYEKFGILSGLMRRKLKNNYGYRIRVSKKSLDAFHKGIKPYIFPSFEYKLHCTNSPSDEGDDIVRASEESEELDRNDLVLERE